MKNIFLILIFSLYGCATKYILPGNRFITPESQGGALHGQFEVQKTAANQLTVYIDDTDMVDGALVVGTSRTGFLYSTSFFEQFDLFWTHTGSGNSLLGGKFQILGPSRTAKGDGHKLALAAAFGGNDHEMEDKSVKFNLSGKEFMLLYGYRLNEFILLYSNLSYSTHTFTGTIHSSNATLDGQKPNLTTTIKAFYLGTELSYNSVFAKVESGYQQLVTTDTNDFTHIVTGFSLGLAW